LGAVDQQRHITTLSGIKSDVSSPRHERAGRRIGEIPLSDADRLLGSWLFANRAVATRTWIATKTA
jgi:hypothetical protein